MRGARECLDDESAARFALGASDADERARAEHHLDTCDTCRRRVAALAVGSSVFTSFVFDDDAPTAPAHGGAIADIAPRAPRGSDAGPPPGERIGRFAVLRTLGRGGMGVVLAAHDPELDRDVAIKLVHPAVWRLASAQARELLRAEARAMARLVHPNVVTVHDLGTVDEQLFVAMELVDGASLDEWLRAAPRTWREILDVCLQAGRGIAAAHRAGLVHRDIKPHNVLVDREGRARIADFGLAALGGADGHDGTPAYMSPEQHAGGRVDAASDQFGFCVLVYEALFGVRPFEGATVAAVGEAVLAGRMRPMPRGPVPARIRRALARGLAVDPAARFARMEDLLAALEPRARRRWLAAVPLIGVAAVVGALVAGGGAEDPAKAVERQARADAAAVWNPGRRAEVAQALARVGAYGVRTSEIVVAEIDTQIARWIEARVEVAARNRRGDDPREIAERRRACVDRRLGEMRATVAVLVAADATITAKAIDAVQALTPAAVCLGGAVANETAPAEPARRARHDELHATLDRASALASAGKYREAIALHEQVVDAARTLDHAPLTAQALYALGVRQHTVGDLEAADRSFQDAIEQGAKAGSERLVALAWLYRAEVASAQARSDVATERLFAARSTLASTGTDDVIELHLLDAQTMIAHARGAYEEAERHARDQLALARRVYPDDKLYIAGALRNVGTALGEQHRHAEAVPLVREGLALAESAVGPDHPELALLLTSLARHLFELGEFEEALTLGRRSVAVAAPDSVEATTAKLNLASLVAMQDPHEAIAIYREIAAGGSEHVDLRINALQNLSTFLYQVDDYPGAAEAADRAIEIVRRAYGERDPRLASLIGMRGAIAFEEGDPARSASLCADADERAVAAWGADDLERLVPLACLAQALSKQGDHASAIRIGVESIRIADRGPLDHYRVTTRREHAEVLRAAGDRSRARTVVEEARRWATDEQKAAIAEQLRALR